MHLATFWSQNYLSFFTLGVVESKLILDLFWKNPIEINTKIIIAKPQMAASHNGKNAAITVGKANIALIKYKITVVRC